VSSPQFVLFDELTDLRPPYSRTSAAEGLFADAKPTKDLRDLLPILDLLQSVDDFFVAPSLAVSVCLPALAGRAGLKRGPTKSFSFAFPERQPGSRSIIRR
jgi:hypothetical protein